MTALRDILQSQIRATGPLTVAQYMTTCLTHPKHGYYTTRDPLGADGDFITAPEVSQMFGELLGLALAQAWLDRGRPDSFRLVELGPGRGTLMADACRAAARVPGFLEAGDIHLVELSPVLRGKQRVALADIAVTWHDDLSTVPEGPLYLIANEFFDALPLRQFQRADTGWSERMIGLDDAGNLAFGLSQPAPIAALDHRLDDTTPGVLVEHAAPVVAQASAVAQRIAQAGGIALIVDYGDWRSQGDTLQALAGGKHVDPLTDPGAADLTAHVDFEAIAKAATQAGARHTRLTPQGVYLARLGIAQRAKALAATMDPEALEALHVAFHRLTDPSEMGTLFKVLAIYAEDQPLPPGFAP